MNKELVLTLIFNTILPILDPEMASTDQPQITVNIYEVTSEKFLNCLIRIYWRSDVLNLIGAWETVL